MNDPLNPTLEEASAVVAALVRNFEENESRYLSTDYSEAQVRKDFIDKFLIALGWDVNHDIQKNPYQQEASVERAVYAASATSQRRADYALALAPHFETPILYIEAKKPSIDIANRDNCFQIIRYANQVGHPIGVLTDFEQLLILDCRYQADIDSASNRILQQYHYSDYTNAEAFAHIFYLVSRPAIRDGAIERYAADRMPKVKRRAGQKALFSLAYKPIDEHLLETLDSTRELLARSLKNKNPTLDSFALTELTQRILDRLVFIRFLEDKLIEPAPIIPTFGQKTGQSASEDFIKVCRRLDRTYNGIVFRFSELLDHKDRLAIDDRVFADVLDMFDYHQSKYLFNAIPLHILGSIYERFLGNVIVATAKRATLEPKPEVRKAGGVYYTPKYVVDYIVQNTVGKLIEGKSPKQISKMRFADIACGSGSFLLGVYDCLLKYVAQWYNERPTSAPKGSVVKRNGVRYLSLDEKARILTDNIYGVDIDSQAVEVAQLSLYLKLLEEETTGSARQYTLNFHRPLLPSLADNVKCGNSLIGTDFHHNRQLDLFDEEEARRVNAFDWHAEFSEIMGGGGFDAVVGNPPYIRIQYIDHEQADYLFANYKTPTSKIDISLIFLERALGLVRSSGMVGMICTSQWMSTNYGRHLRDMLSSGRLHEIVDFGSLPVFAQADTYPAIFTLANTTVSSLRYKRITSRSDLNLAGVCSAPCRDITFDVLSDAPWNFSQFDLARAIEANGVSYIPLRSWGKAHIGTKCGRNEAFVLSGEEAKDLQLESDLLLPYAHRGGEIERYQRARPDAVIIYPYTEGDNGTPILIPGDVLKRKYPRVYQHLLQFKTQLKQRLDSRRHYATGSNWYRHLRAGSFRYIRPPKLVFKGIARRAEIGLLDPNTTFDGARCPAVILNEDCPVHTNFVLGVLNSNLISVHLKGVCPPKLNDYIEFSAKAITSTPIPDIDMKNRSLKKSHDTIVSLVDRMLALSRKLLNAQTDHSKTLLIRQIEATDRQIDRLVYDLYGLTDEEISIVEDAAK